MLTQWCWRWISFFMPKPGERPQGLCTLRPRLFGWHKYNTDTNCIKLTCAKLGHNPWQFKHAELVWCSKRTKQEQSWTGFVQAPRSFPTPSRLVNEPNKGSPTQKSTELSPLRSDKPSRTDILLLRQKSPASDKQRSLDFVIMNLLAVFRPSSWYKKLVCFRLRVPVRLAKTVSKY